MRAHAGAAHLSDLRASLLQRARRAVRSLCEVMKRHPHPAGIAASAIAITLAQCNAQAIGQHVPDSSCATAPYPPCRRT